MERLLLEVLPGLLVGISVFQRRAYLQECTEVRAQASRCKERSGKEPAVSEPEPPSNASEEKEQRVGRPGNFLAKLTFSPEVLEHRYGFRQPEVELLRPRKPAKACPNQEEAGGGGAAQEYRQP